MTGGDHADRLTAAGQVAALDLARSVQLPPGVVGVGIDAVDLERFAAVLGRRTSMAARLFTAGELAYARTAADPVPRLSTRFAAKEAVMKALGLGLGSFPFRDVEVVRVGLGPPVLVLAGAARAVAIRSGVDRWHLSLTHTHRVAMALVVAEGPEGTRTRRGAGPATVSADQRPRP